MALDKIKEKGKKIAAHLLEAHRSDIEYEGGQFARQGLARRQGDPSARSRSPPTSAHNMPEGMEPGLEETSFYDPPNFTFPFGTHICVVEVDATPAR